MRRNRRSREEMIEEEQSPQASVDIEEEVVVCEEDGSKEVQ